MNLSQLSESDLLAAFLPILKDHNDRAQGIWRERFGSAAPLALGPGDDAAVLHIPGYTVSTIDTQTENQDFRLHWPSGLQTGGYDVGWKAAAQNLADVAAMGANPVTLLVSLSLSPETDSAWVSDFARGLCASLLAHQVPWCTVAGGDLGGGSEISVTVAASGSCRAARLRSGARPGDILAVAGSLGTAAAGLALLESTVYIPGDAALDDLVAQQQRPLAAVEAGMQAGFARAMMDISDGLMRDAQRLADASGVNIDINSTALADARATLLPAAQLLSTGEQTADDLTLEWCLTGGENHGMLAAFSPDDLDRAQTLGFMPLGKISETSQSAVTLDGALYRKKGWDHFEAEH